MIGKQPDYLALCSQLQHVLAVKELQAGLIIARGFADVGCEEFFVLPSGELISVLTGQPLAVTSAELEKHFFLVPDVEQLVELLAELSVTLDQVDYRNQRDWVVSGRRQAGGVMTCSARSLEESLLQLCAEVVGQKPGAPRQARLRVEHGS